MTNNDTICALATASGGALAVIRISGPQALSITSSICSLHAESVKASTTHFARITNPSGELIDEVMVSVFRAPKSYTGEDTAEISCHGSSYIIKKILEVLIDNGCRMANPGEYTMRAYLNGKMDLSQAEAVADLIASTNKATHQIAMSQLRGDFSSELYSLREKLLKLTSLLELELDFSDHEDLEFANRRELTEIAKEIDSKIHHLAHSFEIGQALKQGIPVAIVGKTNVGKSTLLNRLLHEERAIVSNVHGTTRDTIEDTIDLQGITFRFIDTAGIRQTTDEIEKIGIERTYASIHKARIVIWVIDEQPTPEELQDILEATKDKSLIITKNKIDKDSQEDISLNLTSKTNKYSFIPISAKHDINIDKLEEAIFKAAAIPILSDSDVIVTNTRHYEALTRSSHALSLVLDGLQMGLSGDLLSEDLRDVLSILSEITGGEITSPEVLRNIFKNFCVGK